MTNVHEAVSRGGFILTRQHWQRVDRANDILGGLIIVVQGGRSFAPDSGSTHRLLGVADYRRWHMSDEQAVRTTRVLRDLCGTGHERTTWQGFTPHFHDATLGDDIPGIMDPVAIEQINGPFGYRNRGDGVSGTSGDWQPYRPDPIRNYKFLEDDVQPDERAALFQIRDDLAKFRAGEFNRDRAEMERDKRRFTETITMLGQQADMFGILIDKVSDRATKQQLRKARADILTYLKEHPDVTGVDNPDDGQMP